MPGGGGRPSPTCLHPMPGLSVPLSPGWGRRTLPHVGPRHEASPPRLDGRRKSGKGAGLDGRRQRDPGRIPSQPEPTPPGSLPHVDDLEDPRRAGGPAPPRGVRGLPGAVRLRPPRRAPHRPGRARGPVSGGGPPGGGGRPPPLAHGGPPPGAPVDRRGDHPEGRPRRHRHPDRGLSSPRADVVEKAHRNLRALTKRDLPADPEAWRAWWAGTRNTWTRQGPSTPQG